MVRTFQKPLVPHLQSELSYAILRPFQAVLRPRLEEVLPLLSIVNSVEIKCGILFYYSKMIILKHIGNI